MTRFLQPGTFLAALLLAALASCAQLRGNTDDHPLSGTVWDASAQRFIDPAALAQRASAARFVLLGEIHDNPAHHEIQRQLLEQLLQDGRRPALVMEQYDRRQQAAIDAVLNGDLTLDGKQDALRRLMPQGWDWTAYAPLVRVALRYRLPVVAANTPRDELRRISRAGFAALGKGEDVRLALDAVWTPQRQQELVRDIYDGHCGKIPQPAAEAIANAQRVRDAVMADTMLKFKDSGAVAIIGSGHARRDIAVPLYLAARAPDATLLALGLMQTDTRRDPQAYAQGTLGLLFDYVWFTPPAVRQTDPCASIAARPADKPRAAP